MRTPMEGTRKIPFSLETFLKRSWPMLLVGAVLILGLAYGLFQFAVSYKKNSPGAADAPVASASSTPSASVVPRKLDGVPVPPEDAALQPYAVMVENAPDARPLAGVAEANLVIEAPVEGGFTRFMLVYDATTTAEQVGPVRSARPYFVELADGLKAVYAHVGGSPDGLARIASFSGFRNLDQFFSSNFFWRSAKRAAPHNVYTRLGLLRQASEDKSWSAGSFKAWQFLPTATTSSDRGDVTEIRVPYGGAFNASWTYDDATNAYVRSQSGAVQKDADGASVSASNVVVLLTDAQVLDEIGRLRVRTTGSGKAVLFRDGQRHDVTWRRKAGEWLTFESVDGNDVFFEPGTTWISIVTSPAMLPGSPSDAATSTTP